MKVISPLVCLLALVLATRSYSNTWQQNTGVKASDPRLSGTRDMNYDHLIVAGMRVGPVSLGGPVIEAVNHLGEPERVDRSTFRGPGYNADEVHYRYKAECIDFTWQDSGIVPNIENGWRGVNVTCSKWSTSSGLRVGSSMMDVISRIGEYCAHNQSDGELIVATKGGIWFWAENRNSPVERISVVPVASDWGGMCKD